MLRNILFPIAFCLFIGLRWTNTINAQVVSICPTEANADTEITITYDASLGCTPVGKQDLVINAFDYIGMQGGVLLTENGNRQYEVAWHTKSNDSKLFLVPDSETIYEMVLIPREYFNIPTNENIVGISCTFTGHDNDTEPYASEGTNPEADCSDFRIYFNQTDCTNGTGIIDNTFNTIFFSYPNPVATTTTITYTTTNNGHINLSIYNTQGQLIRTLADGIHSVGQHSTIWNTTDNNGKAVPNGHYIYVLETETERVSNRMIVVR